ncbi:hypothetical protein SAY86_013835 [Trapa natans]|uniref:Uncharacterized protein n=1 Tax=Trapa natans TaxID=22666 RepID=A0AAN7KY12_TRANT|nr:hypothetical protein SAY86_013835 [Trapa natans]
MPHISRRREDDISMEAKEEIESAASTFSQTTCHDCSGLSGTCFWVLAYAFKVEAHGGGYPTQISVRIAISLNFKDSACGFGLYNFWCKPRGISSLKLEDVVQVKENIPEFSWTGTLVEFLTPLHQCLGAAPIRIFDLDGGIINSIKGQIEQTALKVKHEQDLLPEPPETRVGYLFSYFFKARTCQKIVKISYRFSRTAYGFVDMIVHMLHHSIISLDSSIIIHPWKRAKFPVCIASIE